VPDSTVITFVYNKGGKEIEFTSDKFPADFSKDTYQFVKRYDKLIKQGKNNEPPIKGFSLSGETGVDSTEYLLSQPLAIVLFCEKIEEAGKNWKKKFEKVYQAAKSSATPAFIITSEPVKVVNEIRETSFAGMQIFKCDYKAIETAARVIPTIYLLKQGTVVSKYSGSCMLSVINDLKKGMTVTPPQ
jgi:hypothetical protein